MGKKHEKPLHLDMPFEEALGRFARTDPGEAAEPEKQKEKRASKRIIAAQDDPERAAKRNTR